MCLFFSSSLGSPYYYSATSRGAGPAATATASTYDRHWPVLQSQEEAGWGGAGNEGGTDSIGTARYKLTYARAAMRRRFQISDVSDVWISFEWHLNQRIHSWAAAQYCLGIQYCEDTDMARSRSDFVNKFILEIWTPPTLSRLPIPI